MLISGLTYIGQAFFPEMYPMTANAFIQLLQLPVSKVEGWDPVDLWINRYQVFNWLAVCWAYYLAYKRMCLLPVRKIRKFIAYPFATMTISAMVWLNIITG